VVLIRLNKGRYLNDWHIRDKSNKVITTMK